MSNSDRLTVIALPGGVNPAAIRYAPLQAELGDTAELKTKDLEVYAGPEPPAGYSIEAEVEALGKFADGLGLDRFHLLGYSGGGFVSFAFAGAHPDRLLSLAVFEPAGIPGELSREEAELFDKLRAGLAGLEDAQFMREFTRLQVRPGVELAAPSGPQPEWMAKRPAGLAAMLAAIGRHPFDRERMREWSFPVRYAYGSLTGVQEEAKAGVLARHLADLEIRRMDGIHHFVPAERIYTPEHAAELRRFWARAEATVPALS